MRQVTRGLYLWVELYFCEREFGTEAYSRPAIPIVDGGVSRKRKANVA
jgi:hypothetical protein